MSTCAGPECARPSEARGFCHAHVEQARRRGSWDQMTPLRVFATDRERFDSFVIPGENGCLLWAGATDGGRRYGSFQFEGKVRRAHRVAYEWANGAVPDGLVLDHLCRTTRCVNPEHLEPVTQRENIMRGEALQAKNARKTHCPQGHPYSPENTYIQPGCGGRLCRTCQAARRSHAKKVAA